MSWRQRSRGFLRSWLVGVVSGALAVGMVFASYPPILPGAMCCEPGDTWLALFAGSVLPNGHWLGISIYLLLAAPFRYLVRETGFVFDGFVGAFCGLLHIYVLGGWEMLNEAAFDTWVHRNPWVQGWPEVVIGLLVFLLTHALPVLLAAWLLRAGRMVGSRFAGRDTSSGAS